jgi:hypothetical protein
MTLTLPVAMRRGGRMPFVVTGSIHDDEPVMGARCYEVKIESVQWPRGGEVDERLIADMDDVENDFLKEATRTNITE